MSASHRIMLLILRSSEFLLRVQCLICPRDRKLSCSFGTDLLLLFFLTCSHHMPLLSLHQLHQVASFLLRDLLVINLLQPVPSQDDDLVTVLGYLIHRVLC